MEMKHSDIIQMVDQAHADNLSATELTSFIRLLKPLIVSSIFIMEMKQRHGVQIGL
jgi:hypothetical protein